MVLGSRDAGPLLPLALPSATPQRVQSNVVEAGHIQRMPGLDGLRAWAVLAVVAFHTGLLSAGWVGVDLFMALSGFLITGVLVTELSNRDTVSTLRFWGRRARRLWPGLLTLVAAVAVITALAPGGWTAPTRRESVGALTYSSNWLRLGIHRSYWQLFDAPNAFEHLWSLAIEEQFYLVWPLLLAGAWRWRRRRGALLVGAALATGLAAWQIGLSFTSATIDRLYVGTDTRAPAFLAGALGCLLVGTRSAFATPPSPSPPPSLRVRRIGAATVVLSASVLVAASAWLDGSARSTYRGPLLSVSLAGAALTTLIARPDLWSTSAGRSRWRLLVEAAPLRWIGRWSYGIYLFHWPIILLLPWREWRPAVLFAIVSSLSIFSAAVTYESYEDRIRRRAIRGRWIAVSLAAIAGVAIAVVTVSSVPAPEVSTAVDAALRAPLPATPIVSATTSPSVTVPLRERVLVFGDSVVYELADTLRAEADGRGLDVAVRAAPGCSTSAEARDQNNDFATGLCATIRVALSGDVDRYRPDHIVVMLGGTWVPFRWHGTDYDPCSADGSTLISSGMSRLLTDLGATGAQLDVVLPPTMAGQYRLRQRGVAECYAHAYSAAVAARPRADVLDLAAWVCAGNATSCPDVVDGVPMRRDGLHFTVEGGRKVVSWLFDHVQG